MTFIIRQIAYKTDGSEIVRDATVEATSVTIGRNSDNAVHIPDLAVHPIHAQIELLDDNQLNISSISGQPFGLDGRSVTEGRVDVAQGAELVFGGHNIIIGRDTDSSAIVLTIRRESVLADSEEARDEGTIYTLKGKLPGKRLSAWGFVILVMVACLAWPIYSWSTYKDLAYNENAERPDGPHGDAFWSSGKMSLAHQGLKDDCQACHVDAFVSVRDNACQTCHEDDAHDHAAKSRLARARGAPEGFAAFQRSVADAFNKPQGRCVECHTEHEGEGAMQPVAQQFCADCHDGMEARLGDTKILDASNFGDAHPEFRPALLVSAVEGDNDDEAPRKRVSLDTNPTEDNGLKFPHDLHLDETGGVAQMGRRLSPRFGFGDALSCKDCHQADPSGVRFEPVNMEENCSMCHSLSFDQIGGTFRQLPHGKPDLVKAELRAYFRSTSPRRPLNLGSLPRQRPGDVPRTRTAGDYARAVQFRPSRADQAIRAVFSEGGACYDCHTVDALGGLNYNIAPVTQTDRYMHKGWFNHDVHDKDDCSSCHSRTEDSGEATDLLLPDLNSCRECHVGGDGASLTTVSKPVRSTCSMCHDYHADDGAPWLIRQQQDKNEDDKPKNVAQNRR